MNCRAENRKKKLFCGAWILAGALLLGALTGCGGEPAVTVLPGTSVEGTVSASETLSSATGTTEPSSESKTPVSTQGNTESPSSSSGTSTQTPTVVPVSGVTVAPEVLTLKVGDEWELTVRVLPENADNRTVTYQSSNEKVALCSEGKVTALAAGSAEITVSSADGLHSAKCTVTVEEKNPIPENKRYDPLTGLPTYTPVFEEGVSYVEYNTKLVRHIFCHNLVAYEGATGADAEDYYKNCLTVTEFNRILDQLYERGYVLIDIDYMYEYAYGQNGMLTAKIKPTIKIPAGKKPLVLSVDNVAYPRREHGLGRVDRLQVVDGKLVTYTRLADGSENTTLYSADYAYDPDENLYVVCRNYSGTVSGLPAVSEAVQPVIASADRIFEVSDNAPMESADPVWTLYNAKQRRIGAIHTAVDDEDDFSRSGGYKRVYNGCIASDEYGYTVSSRSADIYFTTSAVSGDEGLIGDEYLYTPMIHEFPLERG